MNKAAIFLFSFLVNSLFIIHYSFATHNRAGEITYRSISSDTTCRTYEITITTYTKTSSCGNACRPTLDSVHMGDGTIMQFARNPNGEVFLPGDITVNTYTETYTYPGSGTYKIYFIDPNRNSNVVNIPNSVGVPFCIFTYLVINQNLHPCGGSIILLNPPIDSGCVGVKFIHNPVAISADTGANGNIVHDSLSYVLTTCLGDGGLPIPGYNLPVASNSLKLNAITGDLIWDSPEAPGEYNIAFLIQEWRGGVLVGEVDRDIQIRIIDGCQNHLPIIQNLTDTCILVGDTLNLKVKATDPDSNYILLAAIGDPLSPIMTVNPATFTAPNYFFYSPRTITGTFKWTPDCSQVRRQPYHVEFKAADSVNISTTSLVDYGGMNITVVGPAPPAPVATPSNSNMNLYWGPDKCPQVTGYRIYRHQGLFTGTIQCPCQTGVPASTGFTFIGSSHGVNDTTFTDTNNGQGLVVGILYCYMITAVFPDGTESCASPQGCAQLKKDLPVITNVTVDSTSNNAGIDTIIWSMATEIDHSIYPPPYEYKIYRSAGFFGSNFQYLATLPDSTDTIYMDRPLDTFDSAYSYKIELYYDSAGTPTLKGHTQTASSVFLTLTPTDKKMILSWQENVPWTNYRYDVFRLNSATQVWDSITSTPNQQDTDVNLINGHSYCYYIRSVGTYSTPGIVDPIINLSERKCAVPVDNVPPCPPQLTVTADCVENKNFLQWTNPDHFCAADSANDVAKYIIYYAPDSTLDFVPITTITNANDTTFFHDPSASLTGCYKVTAVDSIGNESAGNIFCVDTCRQYVLPSVFTPNGDGHNDFFHPCDDSTDAALQKKNCPPYKNVKDVEMKIYNRWGNLVFETTDKDIKWDGTNKYTKGECPAGVYFYTCKVNFFRLRGIETKELHGYVHLIRGKS